MVTKAVTSVNEDASEYTIEVNEALNPFVAKSFDGATVVSAEVTCDEGGTLYVTVVLGGEGVLAKRADLEKQHRVDTFKAQGLSDEQIDEIFANEEKAAAEAEPVSDAERERRKTAVGAGVTQPLSPSVPEGEAVPVQPGGETVETESVPTGVGAGVRRQPVKPGKHSGRK